MPCLKNNHNIKRNGANLSSAHSEASRRNLLSQLFCLALFYLNNFISNELNTAYVPFVMVDSRIYYLKLLAYIGIYKVESNIINSFFKKAKYYNNIRF